MIHDSYCQFKTKGHSDAAKRIADTYTLHRIAQGLKATGCFFAARLSDGTSDGVLYDNHRDAVRHQKGSENWYTYIKIQPKGNMSECDAEVMLKVARTLADKGLKMADPDHPHGGYQAIKRSTIEDQSALMRGVATNLIIPGRDYPA